MTYKSLIECLRSRELFFNLDDDILSKIAALGQLEVYSAKTVIFSEGEQADKIYFLQSGIVAVRIQAASGDKSVVVQPIEERCGVFGWSGLADPNVYTATAACATDVEVVAINGSELMALLERFPVIGLTVMRRLAAIIGSRLRRTREHLTRDVHLDSYSF